MLIVEPSHMTEKLPFRDREDRLGRPPGDDPADVTSAEAVEVTSVSGAVPVRPLVFTTGAHIMDVISYTSCSVHCCRG